MKNRRKKIDFINILITLILLCTSSVLVIFAYYCMTYGVETTIEELADNLEITRISSLEDESEMKFSNTQNPLYSIEEILNQNSEETVSTIKKGYYYTQIDNNAKIIYNALENNIENLKTGTYEIKFEDKFNSLLNKENGVEQLNSSYQQALDAFTLDKPDVFYIDISKMLLMIYSRKTILKTTYTVSIKSEDNRNYLSSDFRNESQVRRACKQLEDIKLELSSSVSGDTYNKIKQIHDYLIENLSYDETISKPNIRNIYGALISKEVVCEGYAKSFKYILDELDIPNIIVVGLGTNSSGRTESHAWNYVYVDENWYAVDITWDDPIIIGGGKLPKKEKYKYFMKGQETFNKNHEVTGKVSDNGRTFVYPELNLEDY